MLNTTKLKIDLKFSCFRHRFEFPVRRCRLCDANREAKGRFEYAKNYLLKEIVDTKICNDCGVEKAINSFKPFTKKDGSLSSLLSCNGCRHKQGKERLKKGIKLKHFPYFDADKNGWFKVCSKCKNINLLINFHKNKAVKTGVNSICKICQRDNDKIKYEQFTEEQKHTLNETNKKNGWKHQKNFYLKNIEKLRVKHNEYAKKPEYREKINKRLRNRTPEQKQAYYDANRESIRKRRMNRRAREKNCAIVISFNKADIIKRDGLNCYLCGILCTEKECHIEHILPISRGGNHKPENAKIACPFCNRSKGNKTLTEYKKRRGDYAK